jgi:hypothetical protein
LLAPAVIANLDRCKNPNEPTKNSKPRKMSIIASNVMFSSISNTNEYDADKIASISVKIIDTKIGLAPGIS